MGRERERERDIFHCSYDCSYDVFHCWYVFTRFLRGLHTALRRRKTTNRVVVVEVVCAVASSSFSFCSRFDDAVEPFVRLPLFIEHILVFFFVAPICVKLMHIGG